MTGATVTLRLDWPYDDALQEMSAARDDVIAGGEGRIFVGSHREEVVTLGRHAPESQMQGRAALALRGVLVRRVERGGGATAHGPGQLVVYPVIHLERCRLDVRSLTAALLTTACDLAAEQGIEATAGDTGVFVNGAKLASVGFRIEHGVVTHGLAVNVSNDLGLFGLIAPCGVHQQAMARLRPATGPIAKELAERLGFHALKNCMLAFSLRRGTGARA